MILRATDPCKIHVFLGFLDTKQISNWRRLSSYYIPNCMYSLYWVIVTSNYKEHLSIWKSRETAESLHTIRMCSIKYETLHNHQVWLLLVTPICLLVPLGICRLNYNANRLGINFTKKSQKTNTWFVLGFLRCWHP